MTNGPGNRRHHSIMRKAKRSIFRCDLPIVSGKIATMDDITQKFIIRVTDRGLVIQGRDGARLTFNPVEALMLLDILKNEESALKQMAQETSPLPMRVRFQNSSDK